MRRDTLRRVGNGVASAVTAIRSDFASDSVQSGSFQATVAPQRSELLKESMRGRQVLLVDDDPALLRLVSQWLTGGGFSVIACDSFEDARRELSLHPPDVLLTDLRLGAFNGLQLVILAAEQNPQPLTVVMSAY